MFLHLLVCVYVLLSKRQQVSYDQHSLVMSMMGCRCLSGIPRARRAANMSFGSGAVTANDDRVGLVSAKEGQTKLMTFESWVLKRGRRTDSDRVTDRLAERALERDVAVRTDTNVELFSSAKRLRRTLSGSSPEMKPPAKLLALRRYAESESDKSYGRFSLLNYSAEDFSETASVGGEK